MDTVTLHLLTKLDAIRESQFELGRSLALIQAELSAVTVAIAAMTVVAAKSPEEKLGVIARLKSIQFSSVIVRGAIMWGVGASISSYLAHGGDPIKLVETLVKLF